MLTFDFRFKQQLNFVGTKGDQTQVADDVIVLSKDFNLGAMEIVYEDAGFDDALENHVDADVAIVDEGIVVPQILVASQMQMTANKVSAVQKEKKKMAKGKRGVVRTHSRSDDDFLPSVRPKSKKKAKTNANCSDWESETTDNKFRQYW